MEQTEESSLREGPALVIPFGFVFLFKSKKSYILPINLEFNFLSLCLAACYSSFQAQLKLLAQAEGMNTTDTRIHS